MKSDQETLFPQAPQQAAPCLLTNRYNLLEILAARLIAPAATFDKYYADLFAWCPGRIPLMTPPFDEDLQALVSAEDPATAFPVAIELDIDVSGPGVPTVQREGTVASAPAGAIPLTSVRAIHFRTDRELEEHLLREYDNVSQPTGLLQVSPGLFGSGGATAVSAEWFREQTPPTSEGGRIVADRQSGSVVLMASVCPGWDEAIETLRKVIQPPANSKRSKGFAAWVVDAMRPASSRGSSGSLDTIVLAEALQAFTGADVQRSWRPAEVLKSIQSAVEPQLTETDRSANSRYFERIEQILRSERPFERLKPGGHAAEKALLLALMRPEPLRFASWSVDESGADWQTQLAAAALVGALRGRRRMPVQLRDEPLDDYLAEGEAMAACQQADTALSFGSKRSVRTSRSRDKASVRLVAGGVAIRSWAALGPAPQNPITADQLGGAAIAEQLADLCVELGWTECLLVTVRSDSGPETTRTADGLVSNAYRGRVEVRRGVDAGRLQERLEAMTDGDVEGRLRKLLR